MARDPPTKPRRRTYRTGGVLPELTDKYRPIPLGYDENGEPDGQIRAFAVNIINRSDRSVFIREGPEDGGQDEAEIPRFQSYTIYEDNGVNRVNIRGSEGGEDLEIRALEAHNDFGIKDKVEAFIRSVSHFFASNKQETVITGSETVISSNITGSDVTFDTDITGVGEGVTFATNITGQDVPLTTNIGDVAEGVTINSNISGQDLDLTTSIGDVAETVEINTDIAAQSLGDINVLSRDGDEANRFLGGNRSFAFLDANSNWQTITETWTLYDNATFDGRIERVAFRLATRGHDNPDVVGWRLQVNRHDGNGWQSVSSREGRSLRRLDLIGRESRVWYIQRYMPGVEASYGWEPNEPVTFSEGHSVRLQVEPDTGAFTGDDWQDDRDLSVDIEIMVTERIRQGGN